MIVAAAALIGTAVLVAGMIDRRLIVAVITASIVANASAVLAVEHGVLGFLLPITLLVVLVDAWDRVAHPRPFAFPDHVPAAWIGLVLVAGVVLSAAIGPFVSDHPVDSATQLGLLTKDLLIVVALVLLLCNRTMLRAALGGLVVGGTAVAAITVVQLVLGWQDRSFAGFGSWSTQEIAGAGVTARAAGPFGDDPNSYAQHLAAAIGAAIGLAVMSRRGTLTRAALWGAAGLMVMAILATSSRTGLLAVAAIATVALVLWPPSRARLAAIAAAAGAVVLGPFGVADRIGTLTQVGSIGGEIDSSLTGRASEALAAIKLFFEHPVAGVGYGAYPSEYIETARSIGLESRAEERSAHSLPLEIAAEQGLIGLAAWTALLIFAVWVALRLWRRFPAEGAAYALALTGFIVTALFLHDVHPRLMWALVAIAVGGARAIDHRLPPPVAADGALVVAMVIQNYVPALGGAERQLASLAPRLRARGIRPVVITRAHEGRPMRDEIDGVPVVRIPVVGPKPLRSLLFVAGARAELRSLRPDVVHAFDTLTPSVIALGHRRRHGTPVATKLLRSGEIGDLEVLRRKRLGSRRVRSLVSEVDRFVAISTDIAEELRALGVPEDRIVHIPNGVDTDRFHPADADTRGATAQHRVIATGRLAPEKRLHEIASRWPGLRERHPSAELVLVGDGPERETLDARPGTLLLGPRDDVPDQLRSATVYVSASNAEGLSNSLLEAMASGLPCVVTDVGGVRDVIVDGVHGIVVHADDLDGLVDRVGELLDTPERRQALAWAARRRVATGWSLDATAAALTEMYHELVASAPEVLPADAAPTPEASPAVASP